MFTSPTYLNLNDHQSPYVVPISARSQESLRSYAEALKNWLASKSTNSDRLEDLTYTLTERRSHFAWRTCLIAQDRQSLLSSLRSDNLKLSRASRERPIVYIFTGQGAQFPQMGRELMLSAPTFRTSIEQSDIILRKLGASWSLVEELLKDSSSSRINESQIAMPSAAALQIALVDLLRSMGLRPNTVIGHSSGEIAAAYSAGILSHEVTMKVAFCRSFMSQRSKIVTGKVGGMIAVGLGEPETQDFMSQVTSGYLSVGCVNSPSSTTVSGDVSAIDELKIILDARGVFNRKLQVDTAYHSQHMRAVSDLYSEALADMEFTCPDKSIEFISSVTGELKTDGFGSSYWSENLRSKVRYLDALMTYSRLETERAYLEPDYQPIIVEIGPHGALKGPSSDILALSSPALKYCYTPTLMRKRSAVDCILECFGLLFMQGCPINLAASNSWNRSYGKSKVLHDLPCYAWDHDRQFWHESRLSRSYRFRPDPYHDLLGTRLPGSNDLEPIWRHTINTGILPWLEDHMVDDLVIFPAAGYMCMAIEAIRQKNKKRDLSDVTFILRKVSFSRALIVPQAPLDVEIQISLRQPFFTVDSRPANSSQKVLWHEFRICSTQDGTWSENCCGLIGIASNMIDKPTVNGVDKPSTNGTTTGVRHAMTNGTTNGSALVTNGTTNGHGDPSKAVVNGQQLIKPSQSKSMTQDEFYSQLKAYGNAYGPTFATLKQLIMNDCNFNARLTVPNTSHTLPSGFQQPHVIHPSTLDIIMHSSLPPFGSHCLPGSVMPVAVDEVQISSRMPSDCGSLLSLVGRIEPIHTRSALVNISVTRHIDHEPKDVLLRISQIELRGLGEMPETRKAKKDVPSNYQMTWSPISIESLPKGLPRDGVLPSSLSVEIVYIKNGSTDTLGLASLLCAYLKKLGFSAALAEMNSLDMEKDCIRVIVDDGPVCVLERPSIETFQIVKSLVSRRGRILWVSTQGDSPDTRSGLTQRGPSNGLLRGFLRSARSENQDLQVTTVDIQRDIPDNPIAQSSLFRLLSHILDTTLLRSGVEDYDVDQEFVIRDNDILVPRILPNDKMDAFLRQTTAMNLSSTTLQSDGLYIVSGGLGDIGRRICSRFSERGAKHILVLSRRPVSDARLDIQRRIQAECPETSIYVETCDIVDSKDLRHTLEKYAWVGPIYGVAQAAVILQDRTIDRMSADDLANAIDAKYRGTQNLLELTRNMHLSFFFMLSSISGIMGTRGQASYCAGNVYQDSVAQQLSSPDSPYFSINVGAIHDSAFLQGQQTRLQSLARQGCIPVSFAEVLAVVDYIMSGQAMIDGCFQIVQGFSSQSLTEASDLTPSARGPMFSTVRNEPVHGVSTNAPKALDLDSDLASAKDEQDRLQIVVAAVNSRLKQLLGINHELISRQTISDLGVDSLMAIELKNWISKDLRAAVQASEILELDHTTHLSQLILKRRLDTKVAS
jgi:acyl transferase domain-containing protein/NAD(P)-dependent dehydrogenase (short-subunit alcohol dehydrogenase family)